MKMFCKLAATFFVLTCSLLAQKQYVNELFETVKVAEGVYAFVSPMPENSVVQSNCTLIVGDESALLVDTGQFPGLAKKMAAEIRKITTKPLRYIVNTHWHFDHAWGNAVLAEAYPGVTIISTDFTRRLIASEGPKILHDPNYWESQWGPIKKMLADNKTPSGRVLTDADKEMLRSDLDDLEHIVQDFKDTKNLAPAVGFDKRLTIDLGKREVMLLWLGRANTGGDAVVWLPESKVMMTGDVVVWPFPFATQSYFAEWTAVLQQLIDMQPATIIPGHGPVMHDTAYMNTLVEMFGSLMKQVKSSVAAGATLEETRKKVNLDAFRPRLGVEGTKRERGFRSFFYYALNRSYEEAKGEMKPEGSE
jgi:cyclase